MNVDWNKLWQQERQKRSWQGKRKQDWNRRAAGFARRNVKSAYADAFLSQIDISANATVLDVGSGPGTLSVPLARLARKVTALDFSKEMLDILRQRIDEEHLKNIETVEASWDDDWNARGVPPHDVVIASRSLAVQDLGAALTKLHDWANQKVILSDRIGDGPFDSALFAAVGREFVPGPDYIFTVNILYQMGIHARVDFISSGGPSTYSDKQEALDAWGWMLEPMTSDEHEKFVAHMESRLIATKDGCWNLKNQVVPKWAVIQWTKGDMPCGS